LRAPAQPGHDPHSQRRIEGPDLAGLQALTEARLRLADDWRVMTVD
jgi:hypothetical protein